ncbi:response regulator [Labrys sp. KB_33_2]|jgi:CheY-like chemotaxis protein|uniref:response regulator n=1 Tax=unclassified Labrys (in: a-proteobacteria) TaxID=2688601 RepID=UPI003EBE213F
MADHDKRTILVVEDEAVIQLLVVDILNDLGFATLEAKDADSAISLLKSADSIDLLITDIGLPGMNGWDLARLARQATPALKVLFLTGYEAAERQDLEMDEGQDVIVKPFETGEFEAKVRSMLPAG